MSVLKFGIIFYREAQTEVAHEEGVSLPVYVYLVPNDSLAIMSISVSYVLIVLSAMLLLLTLLVERLYDQ